MSGRVSSRRRRKVRREMVKDEIKCCVDAFGDIINRTNRKTTASSRNYNRPTRFQNYENQFWYAQ